MKRTLADAMGVTWQQRRHHQSTKQQTGTPTGTKLALSRHPVKILDKCREETVLLDLMAIAERKDRTKFKQQVLNPLLAKGLIEMTIPDKPRSRNQRYRLTPAGRQFVDESGTFEPPNPRDEA